MRYVSENEVSFSETGHELRERRENELLRQQLKKYVETVQVMRRSEGAGGELLHSEEGAAYARSRSSEIAPVRDLSLEVEQYEQKLVQVHNRYSIPTRTSVLQFLKSVYYTLYLYGVLHASLMCADRQPKCTAN